MFSFSWIYESYISFDDSLLIIGKWYEFGLQYKKEVPSPFTAGAPSAK